MSTKRREKKVFLYQSCYKSCYGEEKLGRKKSGKLLCHLVAEITLLANKGHSCVPAGASRRSPQDWNSSEIIPPSPPQASLKTGAFMPSPPQAFTSCVPVPRISFRLLWSRITSHPPLWSRGDLRQYKHCLKCYWHWRRRGRTVLHGRGTDFELVFIVLNGEFCSIYCIIVFLIAIIHVLYFLLTIHIRKFSKLNGSSS